MKSFHFLANNKIWSYKKKGNFYLVIYFSRFYLLSRLLVGNNPRQLWPPRTYKGDPFCNILSRIDSLTRLYSSLDIPASTSVQAKTSLEMDRTLQLISFFENPYGVGSIRAQVHYGGSWHEPHIIGGVFSPPHIRIRANWVFCPFLKRSLPRQVYMMVLIEHHNVRETYKWLHCQYPNRPLQFSIAVSHSKLTRMARAILSFAIFIATQIELSIV